MNQCVFCESTENLNTTLTIALDNGIKVNVAICDKHAEDASVKSAKTAFLEKQKKLDEIIAQAKALGFNLVPSTGPIVLAQPVPETIQTLTQPASQPAPQPVSRQLTQQQLEPIVESGENLVPTELVDRRGGIVSVGGLAGGETVASLSSHDLNSLESKLPEGARKGQVQLAVTEGREGMPLAYPAMRVDGLGTTRVQIKKFEDDVALQRRFKRMADKSMKDDTPNFAREGYSHSFVTCPICRGDKVVNGKTCPKCNGAGDIAVV